ncbi:hypothetical protein GOODEAATRI_012031 [Goodea atripinnis]|uniref:Striatin n=1 Tax=Goodea atripinnis TaxID=208336 RepID=A0ABV0PMV3_9TELE
MSEDGQSCYSGSLDGSVRCWKMPDLNVDPYDNYEHGTPTSVAIVTTDPNQVVVSFDNGETLLYDLNTEQSIAALETQTKDGHDCSVRLWMLDNRTCVQEITAHRKKHDEAIHDVAFHPSQPFIASAGADALAKIFV